MHGARGRKEWALLNRKNGSLPGVVLPLLEILLAQEMAQLGLTSNLLTLDILGVNWA